MKYEAMTHSGEYMYVSRITVGYAKLIETPSENMNETAYFVRMGNNKLELDGPIHSTITEALSAARKCGLTQKQSDELHLQAIGHVVYRA